MIINRISKFFIILFLLHGSLATGQIGISDRINEENDRGPSPEAIEQAALKELARENYYGAMRYYKILIKADPLNAKALKGYGEAAIKYAAFDSALVAFRTLVDHGLTSPDGEPIMRLAEVYYQLGQYEEARALFRRYLFE
ncbi:MAG: tetratricopeptide repeat protein, partial [Saprospiraceae bacterium]|nr:tetratricopeptide repeat protein [Saprospiraceae bacterium]